MEFKIVGCYYPWQRKDKIGKFFNAKINSL